MPSAPRPPVRAAGPVAGRRLVLRAGGLAAVGAGLTACGVRWDDVRLDDVPTPTPPELSVDDLARFEAVVVVRALIDLAEAVTDPVSTAAASAVARHRVHLDRLGPLPGPVPSPSSTPSGWPTTSPPPAGPVDLAALGAAELKASDRLLARVAGPGARVGGSLARLVAVVAASCRATAAGLGTDVPPAVPVPAGQATAGLGETAAAVALVEAHRAAAYGFGVLAVRLAGAPRDAARDAIGVHAAAAAGLVALAAGAGAQVPPAQPAYVVRRPADAAAARALALGLELDVAAAAGTLVARTTDRWRALAADQLTGATLAALVWGPVPHLPGAPDL